MSLAAVLAHRATSAWQKLHDDLGAPAWPGRPSLGGPALTLAVSAWLITLGNFPFWRSVWQSTGGVRPDNWLFLLSLALFVLAWTYLLLSLIAWGRATKAALVTVLLISAAADYFMEVYGVLLDHGMLANIAQTHLAEALDLVSWRLATWLLALGVLPALLVAWVRMPYRPLQRELRGRALGMLAAAACIIVVVFTNYQHYASLLRNHRELRLMLVPHNIAAATHGYLKRYLAAPIVLEVVGADATLAAATVLGKPMLTVLVIGETARSANFSLNGYERPTNPELARRDVLSFSSVTACGTSTAVSVPCIFLDAGREGFHETVALRREGLLDVLQRAGLAVQWLDNNAGCKGVCDRVPHEDLSGLQVPGLCQGAECYDEALLHGLQARIDDIRGDAVIVLHMMGSHGPAYFKRYPLAFEVFTPVCNTVQIDRCERQSIVNAYDNTLRYTDHVLARTIDLLRSNAGRFDTAMFYVSDHGESLGEKGLYLHGVPRSLAPREQLEVPMVVWLSGGASERLGIDPACLRARRHEPLSHDNVFHSILGLSGVRTTVYRPERDLFSSCQS